MSSSLWRTFALALLSAAALFVVSTRWLEVPRASFGFESQLQGPGNIVTAVTPNSSAWRAGLRPGMRIHIVAGSFAQMVRDAVPIPGNMVRVRLADGRVRSITAHEVGRGLNGVGLALTLLRLAFLAMAGLLAFRRPDDRCVRRLVIFLGAFGLGIGLDNNAFVSVAASAFLTVGTTALVLCGTAAAAFFAATFPYDRPDAFNRAVCRIAQVWTAAALLLLLILDLYAPSTQWPALTAQLGIIVPAAFLYNSLAALVMLLRGYLRASGAERQRLLWILAIFALGLIVPTLAIGIFTLYHFLAWLDGVSVFTLSVIPVGLAYVVLRHRVIDVGFVINRAIVYTVVSGVVVAIFVVVETLLGTYATEKSRVTNVTVQLTVALALGFSIRFIHDRVDRAVDRFLFRRRHEAETALRTLTHDAPYITDPSALIQRCVDAVCTFGEAGAAGVWLRRGDRYAPAAGTLPTICVSENDPAVVAMRARRVVVETAELRSALPGVLAFPMVVRGELLGMLVCDAKRDGTSYAPDEIEVIEALAASVGHAYDGLEVRNLREELARSYQLCVHDVVGSSRCDPSWRSRSKYHRPVHSLL